MEAATSLHFQGRRLLLPTETEEDRRIVLRTEKEREEGCRSRCGERDSVRPFPDRIYPELRSSAVVAELCGYWGTPEPADLAPDGLTSKQPFPSSTGPTVFERSSDHKILVL
jgi:hypothetical protein